jgi:hypothetical protein
MKLESKILLALAAVSLLAMVFALIMGELWPAVVCALGAFWASGAYRREKRALGRQL